MINIIEKNKCTGCHACENICPRQCIAMATDSEGFLYPYVNFENCIGCGKCEKVCPILNGKTGILEREHKAYAAINNNETTRLSSSSGGVFAAIAESVIDKGGVVFGAAFDKDFNVIHNYAEKKEDLVCFRGSKYVQSVIGKTYKQAKNFLENGRTVLFTGTPCQIGGLYSFLGKDYDNLITQDLICHGVPSPMVWQKYLEYREKVAHSGARQISFRSKVNGWKMFSLSVEFADGKKYVAKLSDDPYMKAFLRNFCLRPSCYDCAFKTKNRQADITLADFWGIDNILPQMNDDKGTSLLITNSEKGSNILDEIKQQLTIQKVELDTATSFNIAMIKSAFIPSKRDLFFATIQQKPFTKAYNKCVNMSLFVRLKIKSKAILKRILKK